MSPRELHLLQIQMLEAAMSEALADDVHALRAALANSRDDDVSVTLSLPRKSAEKVLALLDAERTTGAVVIPIKELFTTTEAAAMLGLSRPTLMKLVEAGEVDHVMVGTHHRIPARAVADFQRARTSRREKAAEALADFSNEIGFVD
ncbi:MAG: helix-turn-helix domain-containing protein [Dermatophilaceae bacterium]